MGLFSSSGLNTVPSSSEQTTVSPYAQPYVSDLLAKGLAFTGAQTPAYTAQMTSGPSTYQTEAWKGLSGLTLPSTLTQAGTSLQDISTKAQNLPYTPQTFTDTYQAPAAYQTGQFANQYKSPYQAFTAEAAQQYMNPYIQSALNPQLQEARRQAELTAAQNAAKMAQAGAFGGSRQAMVESELQRNLATNLANITGQGYAQAYQQAQQGFQADQARALQDAEMMARYGMTADQAREASRQFGYGQQMTAAQLEAQYEAQRQQQEQAARQFGATYGLQGLQAATSAQQAAGNIGAQQAQYGLANLQALSKAGTEQQALNQAALNAQYNEWLRQQKYPAEMLKLQRDLLTGLPMTRKEMFTPKPSIAQQLAGGVSGASGIIRDLKAMGMPMDKIAEYVKKAFGGVGGITNEQLQAEIDRAGGEYYGPPAGATSRPDGTYETVENGIRTIYDPDGSVIGMESADTGGGSDYDYYDFGYGDSGSNDQWWQGGEGYEGE